MEYRLNRYISASGFCSRREADLYIEEGQVTVDGRRAKVGQQILPGQVVKVSGNKIMTDVEPVYIAFNKPIGVVSTTDPLEKGNMVKFISHEQRIFPIGRLDKDSQGLILLTNDGSIVNKILRAGNKNKKEYIVTVNRPITDDFLQQMASGVPVLEKITKKCEVGKINPTTFKISLVQGLNRQIRRMCDYLNYDVLRLERVQVMNVMLGNLGEGNWRNLTPTELETLFEMLEGNDGMPDKPKRKSPSTLKHQAKRGKELEDKRMKGIRRRRLEAKEKGKNTGETADDNPKNEEERTKNKTAKYTTGKRIGKQRASKVVSKTRNEDRKRGR